MSMDNLVSTSKSVSNRARGLILQVTSTTGSSHVGSALSCVDILTSLFLLKKIAMEKRGVSSEIILSKGHASSALYAVLSILDETSQNLLTSFCSDGSQNYGHVNHLAHPWIKFSTGSLGHGLPLGIGLALGRKKKKIQDKVFVLISDGELNEGTTWESALIAPSLELNNLVCIVDRNRIQSFGNTEEILPLDPLTKKWDSFGWDTISVDGHDFDSLINTLSELNTAGSKPLLIEANTIKGKGISFMENKLEWHYKAPNADELQRALQELGLESPSNTGKFK